MAPRAKTHERETADIRARHRLRSTRRVASSSRSLLRSEVAAHSSDWLPLPSPQLLLDTPRRMSLPNLLAELPQRRFRKMRPESLPSSPLAAPGTLPDEEDEDALESAAQDQPSSPDDGGNFKKSLQIDMKKLVGDAVGNMSISPSSRDIVLAARRGLFIIDLKSPLEIPRFLPQGGTWDVADVQWNPHPSRAEYIVSTSSEKLLIWNLLIVGKTSIEHILHAHYRAVTDINWHTTERDTVVSTGVDSWLWAWDLREPRRPIIGLSAFNSGGTQVKWNRHDPNVLASSHSNEVLIWDRRKGSLPVSRIRAHSSKIYGIDWAHTSPTELVTCSLDKTIKVWDFKCLDPSSTYHGGSTFSSSPYTPYPTTRSALNGVGGEMEPKTIITTSYPIWRARNLPFGKGILSLPQRGEAALEMFARVSLSDGGFNLGHNFEDEDEEIGMVIDRFEGHTDVVKEFVWRRGETINVEGMGYDPSGEFQLITWSKDRTLRFWPVDSEMMQKAGHVPSSHPSHRPSPTIPPPPPSSNITQIPTTSQSPFINPDTIIEDLSEGTTPTRDTSSISFRNPPYGTSYPPALSAPIGHRSILAEVRALAPPYHVYRPQPHQQQQQQQPQQYDHQHRHHPLQPQRVQSFASSEDLAAMTDAAASRNLSNGSGNVGGANGNGSSSGGTGMTRPTVDTSLRRGGTMSRGIGGKSAARMDAFTWLSNVKVGGSGATNGGSTSGGAGQQRGSSEGSLSASISRVGSVSRMGALEREDGGEEGRRSTESSRLGEKERAEKEGEQSLQDEITSVLTKLSTFKVRLEKHDLTKKRTCTLGLHGPWGDSSSVFLRITFTFPRAYPNAPHPEGTPTVEVERNPLISIHARAFMLRRLRHIRETKRPCLEACLRFLLFIHEDDPADLTSSLSTSATNPSGATASSEDANAAASMPAEDIGGLSSEDDEPTARKSRDFTVSLMRNNKNLAEPRTSQGTFGPNGELVVFFRSPVRIVQNVLRVTSDIPLAPAPEGAAGTIALGEGTAVVVSDSQELSIPPPPPSPPPPSTPALFVRSPSSLTDAMRRLGNAARDRQGKTSQERREAIEGEDIVRVMTSLFTISPNAFVLQPSGNTPRSMGSSQPQQQQVSRHHSTHSQSHSITRQQQQQALPAHSGQNHVNGSRRAELPPPRSTVFITNTTNIAGGDRKVAVEYVFEADNLADVCERNAEIARKKGRYDHERVFRSFKTLFAVGGKRRNGIDEGGFSRVGEKGWSRWDRGGVDIVLRTYENFAKGKDIQMLAMISALILQALRLSSPSSSSSSLVSSPTTTSSIATTTTASITPTGTNTHLSSGSLAVVPTSTTSPQMRALLPPTSLLLSAPPPPMAGYKPRGMDYFSVARSINAPQPQLAHANIVNVGRPPPALTLPQGGQPQIINTNNITSTNTTSSTTANTATSTTTSSNSIFTRRPVPSTLFSLSMAFSSGGGGGNGGGQSFQPSPRSPNVLQSSQWPPSPASGWPVIVSPTSMRHSTSTGSSRGVGPRPIGFSISGGSAGSAGSAGSVGSAGAGTGGEGNVGVGGNVNTSRDNSTANNNNSGGGGGSGVAGSSGSGGSSRASWSSLFGAGSVRQFMSGVGDTLLNTPVIEGGPFFSGNAANPGGGSAPSTTAPVTTMAGVAATANWGGGPVVGGLGGGGGVGAAFGLTLPVGVGGRGKSGERKEEGGNAKKKKDVKEREQSPSLSAGSSSGSKSWSDGTSQSGSRASPLSVSDAGSRRGVGRGGKVQGGLIGKKRLVIYDQDEGNFGDARSRSPFDTPPFSQEILQQFAVHVYVYAEMLFSWELYNKRLELLKSTFSPHQHRKHISPHTTTQSDFQIGLVRPCKRCKGGLPARVNACPSCGHPCGMANCSVCRLPVKGLSRSCLRCYHVTHVSCWNALNVPICPTGCGCFCNGMDSDDNISSLTPQLPPPPPPLPSFSVQAVHYG